jgi:LysM repeat protein
MDNNDSNIKPQQTGGLKLMTVFIFVLALHVVVIGGFAVYHLMSGGSADADLVTTDKTHKSVKGTDGSAVADAASPSASQGDKSAPASQAASGPQTATPPTEVATIPQAASGPAISPAPAPNQAAPAEMATPALAPVPALTLTAPKPVTLTPPTALADLGARTPSGPISPELAPPAEPVPVSPAPMLSGPVHMPPAVASAPVHEHGQTYVVKITDSYKKIAAAHHITVAQLKEANHIKGDMLHTGQKLVIPAGKTFVAENATTPTKALNTSLTRTVLSESPSTSTANLAAAPSTAATSASQHHLYTVVKGDTLAKIAHKFKTTPSAIKAVNSITDSGKLTIGKKLKIPSQESRSAHNSTPSSTQPSQVQAKEKQDAASGQLANFVP